MVEIAPAKVPVASRSRATSELIDYGSEVLKSSPVDEIWGSYLAKWKTDATNYEVKKPEKTVKSSSYKPFEFSNYLLGGRGPAVDEGRAPRKAYWWEQPTESQAPGKQLAWWDKLLAAKDKQPLA